MIFVRLTLTLYYDVERLHERAGNDVRFQNWVLKDYIIVAVGTNFELQFRHDWCSGYLFTMSHHHLRV